MPRLRATASRSSSSSRRHSVAENNNGRQTDVLTPSESPRLPTRTYSSLYRKTSERVQVPFRSTKQNHDESDHHQQLETKSPVTSRDSEEDDHLIQVAIRCRPRKRRRAPNNDYWLAMSRASINNGAMASSSSSGSDSDLSSPDTNDNGGGVIEFSSSSGRHKRSGSPNAKPSLSIRVHSQAIGGSKRRFEFDFVFPPHVKQREVYEASVQQQVAHVLDAHANIWPPTHATIVAYGQTGTGKTYTMGMLTSVHDEAERGLIPRAIAQIMDYAETHNSQQQQLRANAAKSYVVMSMSYLQIYLETIQDLLVFPVDNSQSNKPIGKNGRSSGGLQVRQRADQAFYVEGLSEYAVASLEDVHVLLETAARNRVLAATARNKTSSRSHTLLTISLKRSTRKRTSSSDSSSDDNNDSSGVDESDDDDENAYTISFVDLAGSERIDGTLHFLGTTRRRQELRIREAKFINKSLSALGSVIAALAQPKQQHRGTVSPSLQSTRRSTKGHSQQPPSLSTQQQRHIRFRDSQLTKLLQSRLLTGSGRLLLIATVDNQPKNVTETLSTLKFASQCRRVELRSPRSKAAEAMKKRKNLLLEQVFQEMKITYEEREAALHREYQDRLQVLEEQLQIVKSAVKAQQQSAKVTAAGDSLQFASYAALCALADQILGSGEKQIQQRHPPLSSFESEKVMVSYIKALYTKLQTAIKPSPTAEPRLQLEGVKRSHQRSASVAVASLTLMSSAPAVATTKAKPQLTRTKSAPAPAPASPTTPAKREENKKLTAKTEATLTSRLLSATKLLLPGQEDEFQAIARVLLTTPALLRAYHVGPNEEIDSSFSQIDTKNTSDD